MPYTDDQIARVCHEANRALQRGQVEHLGQDDPPIPIAPSWPQFPRDEQLGVINGVACARAGASAEQLHETWRDGKIRNGWRYGLKKDKAARTHPCLVPYWQLPAEQRRKDGLFAAVVAALTVRLVDVHDVDPGLPPAIDATEESVAAAGFMLGDDKAQRLLYGVSRMIRQGWPDVAVWFGMGRQAALDAVEELAGHSCWQQIGATDDGEIPHAPLGETVADWHPAPGEQRQVTISLPVPAGMDPRDFTEDVIEFARQHRASAAAPRGGYRVEFGVTDLGDVLAPPVPMRAGGHHLLARLPRIGDDVHYVSHGTPGGEYGKECRAAKITQVGILPDKAGLCVMNPGGLFFNEWVPADHGVIAVPQAELQARRAAGDSFGCHEYDFAGGTWHWPEQS